MTTSHHETVSAPTALHKFLRRLTSPSRPRARQRVVLTGYENTAGDHGNRLRPKAAALRSAGFDPGSPTGPVMAVNGGHTRRYQHALLTHHDAAGLHEVHGLILQRYDRMMGPTGYFGFPTTDETAAANGRYNRFQFLGSAITWHPTFGVRKVYGYIGNHYWSRLGGPAGKGFPISDEYPHGPTDRVSNFFGGDLYYLPPAPGTAPTVLDMLGPPGIPSRGDWPGTPEDLRIGYCMSQLVERYGLSLNGAAGLVGNLHKESSILPMIIQGSNSGTPMRGRDFKGVMTDFSAQDIMLRRAGPTPRGPRGPGIGLAQWTWPDRRDGLFRHSYQGVVLGPYILFSMDAQIDYLVTELSSKREYRGVLRTVMDPAVSVDDASDTVVRDFERPESMKTPATRQAEFQKRRKYGHRAKALYPWG